MALRSGQNAQRLLALGVLLALIALRIVDPQPIQNLRAAAFDAFQQMKPRSYAPVPVTILDIDDDSLALFGQWPWPRSVIAALVDRSFEEGAVAMGFDIVFAEPDRLSPPALARALPDLPAPLRSELEGLPETDATLADALARGRVVLGQTSSRFGRSGQIGLTVAEPVPHALLGEDATPYLQRFPDLVTNLQVLEERAAGRGVFSIRPDPDGIFRQVPLVMVVGGALRLGLGPEVLRVATGGQAFALRGNAAGADGVVLGGQFVRTAGDGTVWPYLTRPRVERRVSAADLLSGTLPQGRLRGQLILVGTSAIGLEDFRATALGLPMPGVEIHAQLLENILTDTLLQRPNYAISVELALGALLGMSLILLGPWLGAGPLLVLILVLTGAIGAGAWGAFASQRVLIDPAWPALVVFILGLLMLAANYLREERSRRQVRAAFGQYVSPALVEQLTRNPEALTLGGERRELTLLFSDVRDFTAIAESYREDPVGLTHLMNSFLTELSDAILQEGGTIDKFMGDAVMAFWNAPLDSPDHEAAACRAALAMQAKVAALNAERAAEAQARQQEAALIDVGIGLNTGPCTVGNMGSAARFDYSALGDAVNLAARLEGQSKTYGVGILIGSSVATRVRDRFALLDIDLLRVKGKALPERVHALLGDETLRNAAGFDALNSSNDQMRAAYAAQDWDGAAEHLQKVAHSAGAMGLKLDPYINLYRARIATFRADPPPEDWGGVTIAQSK